MEIETQRPDLAGLETFALTQGGYFDRRDALAHYLSDRLLSYHTRTGRFERLYPGVYRLRAAPPAARDDLLQAWVWSNYRGAISHESALALYGLSDVLPYRVQLTVPPDFGRTMSRFDLHRAALTENEAWMYDGVRVTSPTRTIVDAAVAGVDPEQITLAVMQGIHRALLVPDHLAAAASRPRYRHRRTILPLIQRALLHAAA